MENASRPSQATDDTLRMPFKEEEALAVDLLLAFLKANGNQWLIFAPANCVEWGKDNAPDYLRTMCNLVPGSVLQGFYILVDKGYFEQVSEFMLKGEKPLFDRLGVAPPADAS